MNKQDQRTIDKNSDEYFEYLNTMIQGRFCKSCKTYSMINCKHCRKCGAELRF